VPLVLVESGSDLYALNRVDHFGGNDELPRWLSQHWEHEELQHGRKLTAYVQGLAGIRRRSRL
jgi:hypothetical protein